MKAIELNKYLLSLTPELDVKTTVDKIVVGDENKELKRVLVTWMCSNECLDYAINNNFDMILTHEPTFWNHRGDFENMTLFESKLKVNTALERLKKIKESGIVILRNHDVWDRLQEYGTCSSLAKFLGFHGQPVDTRQNRYQQKFNITPMTVAEIAKHIATKTATLGEDHVIVFGNKEKVITNIGIGTGCCCILDNYLDMNCDVSLLCDDGSCYWQNTSYATSLNHPVIVISHGTSEEPGMIVCRDYLESKFPNIYFEYYAYNLKKSYIR